MGPFRNWRKPKVKVVVFKGTDGRYWWHKVALRGNLPDRIVSDSGGGYTRSYDAKRAAIRENPGLTVEVQDA